MHGASAGSGPPRHRQVVRRALLFHTVCMPWGPALSNQHRTSTGFALESFTRLARPLDRHDGARSGFITAAGATSRTPLPLQAQSRCRSAAPGWRGPGGGPRRLPAAEGLGFIQAGCCSLLLVRGRRRLLDPPITAYLVDWLGNSRLCRRKFCSATSGGILRRRYRELHAWFSARDALAGPSKLPRIAWTTRPPGASRSRPGQTAPGGAYGTVAPLSSGSGERTQRQAGH